MRIDFGIICFCVQGKFLRDSTLSQFCRLRSVAYACFTKFVILLAIDRVRHFTLLKCRHFFCFSFFISSDSFDLTVSTAPLQTVEKGDFFFRRSFKTEKSKSVFGDRRQPCGEWHFLFCFDRH